MTTRAQTRNSLEARRVKAAKTAILLALAFLAVLSVWQFLEAGCACNSLLDHAAVFGLSTGEESVVSAVLPAGDQSVDPAASGNTATADPLGLAQAGIDFVDNSQDGHILWYQSFWDVPQSRVLLERALGIQGWQPISADDELVMSFIYAPAGVARGPSLLISFYPLEMGCSILVELL